MMEQSGTLRGLTGCFIFLLPTHRPYESQRESHLSLSFQFSGSIFAEVLHLRQTFGFESHDSLDLWSAYPFSETFIHRLLCHRKYILTGGDTKVKRQIKKIRIIFRIENESNPCGSALICRIKLVNLSHKTIRYRRCCLYPHHVEAHPANSF